MNTGFGKGYKPYTDKQWKGIKSLWDLYKSTFGLEGDLYIELQASNISNDEKERRITERNAKVEKDMETWRQLRNERERG